MQTPAIAINHIALSVSDLEQSTRFYKDVLQLKMIEEPFKDNRHVWFALGGCQLHLISGAVERVQQHINTHIAFTVANMDEYIQRLRAAGVAYGNTARQLNVVHIRPDGIQQIFFQDPDGHWLELNNDSAQ